MNNVKKITLKHYNQIFITTNKEKILKAARGKRLLTKKNKHENDRLLIRNNASQETGEQHL